MTREAILESHVMNVAKSNAVNLEEVQKPCYGRDKIVSTKRTLESKQRKISFSFIIQKETMT